MIGEQKAGECDSFLGEGKVGVADLCYKRQKQFMSKIIPYNSKLKQLARELRKNMTYGEVLLWNELKDDKTMGLRFRSPAMH